MSLRNGYLIRQYSWTPIPMTQEIINKVLFFGKKNNIPDGLVIRNGKSDIDINNFENGNIEGVYNYNI